MARPEPDPTPPEVDTAEHDTATAAAEDDRDPREVVAEVLTQAPEVWPEGRPDPPEEPTDPHTGPISDDADRRYLARDDPRRTDDDPPPPEVEAE
jgi:hypothetical protein